MNNRIYEHWDEVRNNINKQIKLFPRLKQMQITNQIGKSVKRIMENFGLSLIYDKYGNQLYEKTSAIKDYFKVETTSLGVTLRCDKSKLIETKSKDDNNNSDFIPYDSLRNMNKHDVKNNLDIDSDFQEKKVLDHSYGPLFREKRKNEAYREGINQADSVAQYIIIQAQKNIGSGNRG